MLRGGNLAFACLVTVVLFAGCVSGAAKKAEGATELQPGKLDRLVCHAEFKGIDLQAATISDLQAALAKGKITSVQLVEAYIDRIAAIDDVLLNADVPRAGPSLDPNPPSPVPDLPDLPGLPAMHPIPDENEHYTSLNSIRVINEKALEYAAALDAERAAGSVRGPLHGIPILLKDNVGTIDVPTTAGSQALATNYPPNNATQVDNLVRAGAIILGKVELAEFANWMSASMPNGYSSIGGQVMNAYTGRNPSGSSSGSGVAASMAFSAATVGSETSGSIIGPSSSNSVVGLKPTMGIVSRYGVVPLAASFDMTGPMVRNVEDAAILLGGMVSNKTDSNDTMSVAVADPDFTKFLREDFLDGVNVGYNPSGFSVNATTGEPNNNYTRAVLDLERLGAVIEPIPSNLNQASNVYLGTFGVVSNEFNNGINNYLRFVAGPDLPIDHLTPVKTPNVTRSLTQIIVYNEQHSENIPYGQSFLQASDTQPGDPATVLAGGTAVREASKAVADQIFESFDVIVGNNFGYYGMGTAAGYPSLSVPSGYGNQGGRLVSPQSITFTAPGFEDGKLLGYGYAFEQATHYRVRPEYQNATLLSKVCPGENGNGKGQALADADAEEYDPMAALPRLANGQRVPLI